MSGPKYSHFDCDMKMVVKAYSPTDLEERVKQLKSNYYNLMSNQNELRNLKADFELIIEEITKVGVSKIEGFNSSGVLDEKQTQKLNGLKEKYKTEINKLRNLPVSLFETENYENRKFFGDPKALIKVVNNCQSKTKRIKEYQKLMEEKTKGFYDKFIAEANKILKKKIKGNKKYKAIVIDKDIDFCIINMFDEKEIKELSTSEKKDISNMLNHIESYINEKFASSRQIKELETLYAKITEYTKRDLSVGDKIKFIKSEYDNFLFLSYQIDDTDLQYYEEYIKNKQICDAFSIDTKKYGNISNYDGLKAVATLVKKELNTTIKEKYISDTIKDVMNDYGYNALESINLKKDDKADLMLYKYDDESALSIYKSDDGMVMMELVATGDESEMSENDKVLFLEKMYKFCTKYPKIIEALNNKGITVNRREEMPVKKEFVRKITINKGIFKKESAKQIKRVGE